MVHATGILFINLCITLAQCKWLFNSYIKTFHRIVGRFKKRLGKENNKEVNAEDLKTKRIHF